MKTEYTPEAEADFDTVQEFIAERNAEAAIRVIARARQLTNDKDEQTMAINPYRVWANMKMKVWPERYWLMDIAGEDVKSAAEIVATSEGRYSCILRDQAGLTAVADEETFAQLERKCTPRERFGPFKIVSTDGELPFDVIGFLQPLLLELNTRGIKAGPQCGAVFDHLFIYENDVVQAEEIIQMFIKNAKLQITSES